MRLTRRITATCVALYVFSQLLFLINIQFPRGHNFDESHYVPSAKQFLELKENQNSEHPPLGKLLMAAGIAIGGDRPIGWRLMSTVFGSLTLLGMYFWALAVFKNPALALWVALLTLCNSLLYVQARIGMLDTFMFAFIVWGVAAFCYAWDPILKTSEVKKALLFSGLMFGLGTACKWFALMPWMACVGLVVLVRVLQGWNVTFGHPSKEDWFHPDLFKGLRATDLAVALVWVPLGAYSFTFIPFLFINPSGFNQWDFILMQKKMYEGQRRVVNSHPYMSHWSDWPLLTRPIWYAFDKEDDKVRGVLLLGNPWIMWTGLVALAACVWGWLKERRRDGFLILAFFSVFYGSWIMIPRKVSYYYYYYPAGMTLSLALAYVFHRAESSGRVGESVWWAKAVYLGIAFVVFVYFFPILAALPIPGDSFRHWMWFRSWI